MGKDVKGMEAIWGTISEYVSKISRLPSIRLTDIVEIIIITILIYHIMVWIKRTKAWILVKGLVVLLSFTLVAVLFEMNTIIWLAEKTLGLGATAIIIVFQPELRKALEQIGRKNIITGIIPFDESKNTKERFSDKTVAELTKAAFALGKTKTGALIVMEQQDICFSPVTTCLFQDRIVSATCYLPLSDNMEISKDLGTRHRAGLGVSEVTDSMTIIVSEETGNVSIAMGGRLLRDIDAENLREKLITLQNKTIEEKKVKLWKGRRKDEK